MTAPPPIKTIGFIGLGVMGEPMCGHLARRSGKAVLAYDREEMLKDEQGHINSILRY